ncbi:homoserine dehydrogenase [Cognatilysobacter segetis]|uniref:homoserine dehydrogenase n=1 Tax=Cognatilysobacter segetis TaxID=2492394 RepID=UPI001060FA43|nr:homoserine dehydrogenase [Lysobacter segetis]
MAAPVRIEAAAERRAVVAEVALLGVGNVGAAFLERIARRDEASPALRLVHVADSRRALSDDIAPADARQRLARVTSLPHADPAVAFDGAYPAFVVDATGSDAVAARHADWLARGVHVVTASKLGQGAALSRWRRIEAARRSARTHYGDSATVGAGLPLLRSLRALRDGGDAISGIAGVLSGSMAWLFAQYDGRRPFSGFVRRARAAGYTEPDPREDLSGEDVRRKLLILARAAGFALEVEEVEVESLVPRELADVPLPALDAALEVLDAPLRARFADAYRRGKRLCHVARLAVVDGRVRARVGLESLAPDDPLAAGQGTDNRVALRCGRYDAQPLVIQGPGAGADVTAAALLDDVLAITRDDRRAG